MITLREQQVQVKIKTSVSKINYLRCTDRLQIGKGTSEQIFSRGYIF